MEYQAWLTSSLVRQYPRSQPLRTRRWQGWAARGQQISFQAAIRMTGADLADVTLTAGAPRGLQLTIRRVGCVPVPHHNTQTPEEELDGVGHVPGYVPDVLYPEARAQLVRNEVTSFWITVTIDPATRPGSKSIVLTFELPERRRIELKAVIHVAALRLKPRRDFRVTHWFYADAIADYYKLEPFSDAFWPLCEAYMHNYARHGNDMIYVPAFTPPLDGVKRPTQLLHITPLGKDRYRFNWSAVEHWIKLARKCGLTHFEWTHLFAQWGAKFALRVYDGQGEGEKLLWPASTPATAPIYRTFLKQFLCELQQFLQRHGIDKCSYFHVSDEPQAEHLENYRAARQVLRELAPWMRVFDALSHIEFAQQGLTDLPVAVVATAKQFADAGLTHWAYFCCGPRERYVNRLLDTPLVKVRMAAWLFYRFGARGFLHWGYNYWQRSQSRTLIDPFTVSDAGAWPGWAYGDPFVVYPGPQGPLDSIRWEVFAESLQDYALLQTRQVAPAGSLLADLKDYADFPKDARWIEQTRRKLLRL